MVTYYNSVFALSFLGLVTNEFYAEINMNALASELKEEFNKEKR